MRPVSVNFSVYRWHPYDRAGWVLLVVAAGVGLFLAWYYAMLVREFDAGEAERARLQPPVSVIGHAPGAEEKAHMRSEMRFARRVIEQLDTPWLALFGAVETAYDDNVTLLGVEPEPERREVRLLAEAKDAEAMLAYVRQVRQSPVLRDAWLTNHQVNLQDPLRPVRFSINARWLSPPAKPSSTVVVADDTREEATTDVAQAVAGNAPEEAMADLGQAVADDTHKEATTDVAQAVVGNTPEEAMADASQAVAGDTHEEVMTDVGQAVAGDTHEEATTEVSQLVADETREEAATDVGQFVADDTRENVTTDATQEGEATP